MAENPGLDFSNKFRNIAETQVNEDCPKLSDCIIGWELIDKLDGGDRAAGALALRIGDKWGYVPCFWFDGRLAGSEMMYVKQWDKIVPARDAWLKALRSDDIGDWVTMANPNISNGIRADQSTFTNIFTSSKYASVCECLDQVPRSSPVPMDHLAMLVMAVLPDESKFDPKIMLRDDSSYNKVAQFLDTVVRPKISDSDDSMDQKPAGGIRVITDGKDDALKKLTPEVRRAFYTHGFYILDDRPNNAKVYVKNNVNSSTLKIPGKNGLYSLCVSDGDPKPAMVFISKGSGSCCNPCCISNSWSSNQGAGLTTQTVGSAVLPVGTIDTNKVISNMPRKMLVIPCDDSGFYTREDSNKLFGSEIHNVQKGSMKDPGVKATTANLISLATKVDKASSYFNKDAKDFARPNWKDYVLLHPKCDPIEFTITNSYTDKKDVDFMASCDGRDGLDVAFVAADVAPGVRGKMLYIPEDGKLVIKNEGCFKHGDMQSAVDVLFDKGPMANLSVLFDGSGYRIKADMPTKAELEAGLDGRQTIADFNKNSSLTDMSFAGDNARKNALVHLAVGYDIHAHEAAKMLTEAVQHSKFGPVEYMVKVAQLDHRTNERFATSQGNPGAGEVLTDIKRFNGYKFNSGAGQEKEKASLRKLLDTSFLQEIVGQKDVAESSRKLFVDIMDSMDAKFRMLCLIYWHRDKFEEKFGDGLDNLISQLRRSALDDGDLLIYLKEKGSDAGGLNDATRGSISSSMGVN